ncbi:MAG TPA: metal-dependent hydrolase, partial [Sphingomonas sp.]
MSEPIEVVRHARARRARLSIDPASGRTRLTLPPR